MTTVSYPSNDTNNTTSPMGWFAKCESWLDSKGKGVWIAAFVLGFIFFWPVGLAILFYAIFNGKLQSNCKGNKMNFQNRHFTKTSSGNTAFDAYKAETLQRLEQEQANFETFLERLRAAKDKTEFEQFMDERADDAKSDTSEK